MKAFDYSPLLERLKANNKLAPLAEALPAVIARQFSEQRWGDIPRWQASLAALPEFTVTEKRLNESRVGVAGQPLTDAQTQALTGALQGLHPWRKGPFELFGVHIDTEWRSDWKWDRIKDHIDLKGKTVLDVGCGSGYHAWRMKGAGADLVVGIDPSPLFIVQYWALQRYLNNPDVWVVPAGCEDMPAELQGFDTVFSMGVLYHRRSPMDHLLELRQLLKPGGQLVLETLVVDGDQHTALVPSGRYGMMGNVWFIPSVAACAHWLAKLKFTDIQVIDVNTTSLEEQRATDWMRFQSLQDFLDPNDQTKTVEGYPAPKRAVLTARAPR